MSVQHLQVLNNTSKNSKEADDEVGENGPLVQMEQRVILFYAPVDGLNPFMSKQFIGF